MNKFLFQSKIYWIFLFFLLSLFACLDEINLQVDESNERNIVVQGKLIKGDPSVITVSLSILAEFKGFDLPSPLSAEKVMLTNDAGQTIELPVIEEGLYKLEIPPSYSEFRIATGQSFQLMLRTLDGQEIHSVFEPMLPVPKADSISFETIERFELNNQENEVLLPFIDFNVHTPLRLNGGQASFLKWSFSGVFKFIELQNPAPLAPSPKICYISEITNREKVVVFDGNESSKGRLDGLFILEENLNFRFAFGYYLTVIQESLSPGAFDYWNSVGLVTDRTGSIFEAPAGEIPSNFTNVTNPENKILGYFYAVEQDTIRKFIDPDDVGLPSRDCKQYLNDYPNSPLRCKDCLTILNSTLEKPVYWIE